jgi:rod shape-determining protein MreC
MPPPYQGEQQTNGKRRDVTFAAVVLLLALVTAYLPETTQQQIASSLQASVLRPFIATQELLAQARRRASEVGVLTERLDSLTAIVSTHSALVDENRTLRALLDLADRTDYRFVPASVLRPGTPGSERMFIVDVGGEEGIPVGAPVVAPHGLVGQIREVRRKTSVGMDWSHPDFRVSAMLVDGTTYGIVERQRGRSHEDDRMILNGTAYNAEVRSGMGVVTSGLGGVFPRGIPVGKIHSVLDAEGSWRRSFWIQPMVELGSVTHVLVLTEGGEGDYSSVWPADSLTTREEAITRNPGP